MSLGAPRRPWSWTSHLAPVLPPFPSFFLSVHSCMLILVSSLILLLLLHFSNPLVIMEPFAHFLAVVFQVAILNQSHYVMVPGLVRTLVVTQDRQVNSHSCPAESVLLQLTVVYSTVVELHPWNYNTSVDHDQLISWSYLTRRVKNINFCLLWAAFVSVIQIFHSALSDAICSFQ